ncbi:MAG: UDP-N-acetylmuramoyl-L-alanyl-D-glutamate--2,6-diaminopimelate ligase [Bacteroidales bacterium]|jgi:UDP-N-acetylmuramoyl-L-alanyl-D-glutamate--2,6-diaminopimelate ligase|nr:UDP-N-acetylmuramoyl-L-alanyl-D-glutamate--2,6-diaminopimelate ligase [Bacteroidales bacterium]
MKRLGDLLKGIDIRSVTGDTGIPIDQITSDSRKAGPGTMFVAIRGTRTDGHLYIGDAVRAGSPAVVCERLPEGGSQAGVTIVVGDSNEALGILASQLSGNPSASLRLVGVTGTNGKTTVATLLYRLFTAMGYRCGLLSTVCNYINDRRSEATHTTPDQVELNALLAEMVASGCDYAFMEVSSHAIDQRRIAGLTYAGGIFTNLTHDHLDYHGTLSNYLNAKKKFFDSLGAEAFAVVNADDRNGRVMVQNCAASIYTYSVTGMADFRASVMEMLIDGMKLKMEGNEIWTPLIGDFNASNLLAVYAASRLLGVNAGESLRVLSMMTPVPGRLEIVRSANGITGLVDYAHSPDALRNVTGTINRIRKGKVRLIIIVGAGGDRDRTKRPLMASIAARGSDLLILTSDNPRSEDPEKIIDDMEAGLDEGMRKKTIRISDRRSAIRTGVKMAQPGDLVLVAGKGHETYQEINGVRHHFDDREELAKAFIDENSN